MRHRILIVIACFGFTTGILQAQERVPLPVPDPGPPGSMPPPSSPPPNSQNPEQLTAPPQPFGPAPNTYAPPPPPLYPPLEPAPYFGSDPMDSPLFWLGVDGLVFWTKNQPLSVPIVTTGPASQGANAGALGMPGTTSLDGPLNYGAAGGARFYGGGWFNMAHTIGMDGSLFILGQQSAGFGVVDRSGVGNLVINEPVAGAPFVTQVSAPGVESGSVFVNASSRFGGGDLNGLFNLCRANGWTINLLGGYRFLELDENLSITANSNLFTTTTYTDNMGNVLANAPPGSAVSVVDQFGTRNQFNGGQLGCQFQYMWRRLSFSGATKLAIGGTHEVVMVNGFTTVFPVNGNPVPLIGGNYATLQSGRYSVNRFALAPELLLKVGYQITPRLRAQIGYDFLYLTSVARPGNQIDNTYDGVTHPLVPMASSSFWAQGLTLSLQFNF